MTKTWGDIYRAHLRKGEDHGYAAHMADAYCERNGIATLPKTNPASKRATPYTPTLEEFNALRARAEKAEAEVKGLRGTLDHIHMLAQPSGPRMMAHAMDMIRSLSAPLAGKDGEK